MEFTATFGLDLLVVGAMTKGPRGNRSVLGMTAFVFGILLLFLFLCFIIAFIHGAILVWHEFY